MDKENVNIYIDSRYGPFIKLPSNKEPAFYKIKRAGIGYAADYDPWDAQYIKISEVLSYLDEFTVTIMIHPFEGVSVLCHGGFFIRIDTISGWISAGWKEAGSSINDSFVNYNFEHKDYIISVVYRNGTNPSIYVNGQFVGVGNNALNWSSFPSDLYLMNWDVSQSTSRFKGIWYAFMLHPKVLSSSEIEDLHQWLKLVGKSRRVFSERDLGCWHKGNDGKGKMYVGRDIFINPIPGLACLGAELVNNRLECNSEGRGYLQVLTNPIVDKGRWSFGLKIDDNATWYSQHIVLGSLPYRVTAYGSGNWIISSQQQGYGFQFRASDQIVFRVMTGSGIYTSVSDSGIIPYFNDYLKVDIIKNGNLFKVYINDNEVWEFEDPYNLKYELKYFLYQPIHHGGLEFPIIVERLE